MTNHSSSTKMTICLVDLIALKAMSNMKVDHIFSICSLNADGKWFAWVKGEGHKASSSWGRVFTQHPSINLELQ